MIRAYQRSDYPSVISLIERCGLPVVTADELEGFGLLWIEADKPVGFVWALINEGATVYIDHFCVDPDFREKDQTGRSKVAVDMMLMMLMKLAMDGKTRIQGVLQETPYGKSLERIYWRVGMKVARPHAYVYGNIPEILYKLKELKNVKHAEDNHSRSDA